MIVKVKKLNEDAVLPQKSHNDDFCYDIVATSEEEVAPNVWRYGTGLCFELSEIRNSDTIVDIDLRPRSSIWKTGMVLSNSQGTIDFSYRGEVMAVFYHIMPNMPRYKVGDKIAQIKIGTTIPMQFVFVEELSETERGAGGYGSTGK